MKVLFAVQDEQISTKIVKEYQKKYKEIISYKNIYYFNAILKELQRDKTYDRIVIDEEIEELNSTNYKEKDKFIFDKLDNISDEAIDSRGQDIPIILICSEKRTKTEEIFVKLFGLGIYNALIGNDRSTEEVCKLIERPRSKKQAKIYYHIDSEEVQYKQENQNEVSEEEMQNILLHFKKLGNNRERYADSFSRIIKQYNNEQIKIIIKVLPLNVRSILEEESSEYQKIISTNNMKIKRETKKEEKGTVEKLLGTNNNKDRITKPVVIPSTMKKSTVKKLEVKKPVTQFNLEEFDIDDDFEEVEDIIDIPETPEIIEKPVIEEFDEAIEPTEVAVPRKRGRPKKNSEQSASDSREASTPRKRGRPKKVNSIQENAEKIEEDIQEISMLDEDDEDENTTLPGFDDEQYVEDEEIAELPGFEDDDEEITELPGFEEDDDEVMALPGFEEDDEEEITELPGFEEDDEEEVTELQGFEQRHNEDDNRQLPGFEENNDYNSISGLKDFDEDDFNSSKINSISSREYEHNDYDYNDFENLLTSDKKVVAFVGTSKNGTSFIVNNVAHYLSMNGINTAILDTTQNKNSYYIYTDDKEELRKKAISSIPNLLQGNANGLKVNKDLTLYTSVPGQGIENENIGLILDTLVKNHSVVLIDSDFDTAYEYFDKVQEMYLVQSMDVLTIQPLTAFLRELKAKNILNQSKIRIILNKALKLRGVSSKNIIGGMSKYNDPEMSFMTDLFDRDAVKYMEVPFDEEVYAIYLEGIIDCKITINRYPKNFGPILKELANMVYPLLPNSGYKAPAQNKAGYDYSTGFSTSVNNTLNNMKNRY